MRGHVLTVVIVLGALAGCRSPRTTSVTVRVVDAEAPETAAGKRTPPDKVVVYPSPEVVPCAYRVIAHLAYSATNATTEMVNDSLRREASRLGATAVVRSSASAVVHPRTGEHVDGAALAVQLQN